MNAWPIRRRFSCGSVTPASAVEKLVLGMDDVQIGAEMRGEFADDRFFFVLAQQAVVDQDARQLRADRPIQQRRHDRRIDAARQPADHAVDRRLAAAADRWSPRRIRSSRQVPVQPQTAREKIGQDFRAPRRVRHFGMKLQAVDRQRCDA